MLISNSLPKFIFTVFQETERPGALSSTKMRSFALFVIICSAVHLPLLTLAVSFEFLDENCLRINFL